MLQVAERGYAELLRNPISGTFRCQNPGSSKPLHALLSA
jgi:hypothetical protein